MLRVVVAVALAVSLLGVATPAVETARVDHAEARLDAELEALAATAARLEERNDPTPPGVRGARRTTTLHVPGSSWATAGLDSLTVPGPSDDHPHGVVRYRVAGGQEKIRWVSAPLVGPPEGFSIEGGGTRRVVLELGRWEGEPVVVVRHPEFKSHGATRAGHDRIGDGPYRPAGREQRSG